MKQYINKAAVVAEIERIKKKECPTDTYEGRCKLFWFQQFLSFLDTLEAKEVDLEKEIVEVKHNYKVDDNRHTSICSADIEWLAKHFFELGLKAQKGE